MSFEFGDNFVITDSSDLTRATYPLLFVPNGKNKAEPKAGGDSYRETDSHPTCLLYTNFCLWNGEFSNLVPVFHKVVAGTN